MFNAPIIYLIFIIPATILVFFIITKNFLLQKEFNKNPLTKLRNYNFSRTSFLIKNILLILSFTLVVLSLMRPQWGLQETTTDAKGIDIIFTLDVSKSMKATDMNIGNNEFDRLVIAKSMIENFVIKNPQNRYGLVVFAGIAFVSTPLTIDHESFITFLGGVTYDNIEKQGTNLDEALKASIDRFHAEDYEKRGKAIIVMSDGGETSENNFEDFAKVAKEENINIFTIGIGNTKEVAIPEGKDFFGKTIYKQYKGEIVMTKLNETPLKEIAKLTDGKYFHAKKKDDLEKISEDIKNMQSTIIKKIGKQKKEDKYQYFLLPAFLLFCFFIFIPTKKIKNMPNFNHLKLSYRYSKLSFIKSKFNFLKNKIINKYFKFFILIIMILPLSGCSIGDTIFRYYNAKANESISKNYLEEGKDKYEKAQTFSDNLKYIAQNNKEILNYQENKFEQVEKKFQEIIYSDCNQNPKEYCDQIYYNQGNNYYRLGELKEDLEIQKKLWTQAIESYKKTLELNKEDKEAQENIEFIANKIKESEQKEKDESSQSKDSENNNKENNNSDNKEGESKEEKLSQEMNNEVEKYLKNMETQEKNLQKYFQQQPQEKNNQNDPFDNFFNDPFFNNFFQNQNINFNNQNSSNEKDW